MISDIGIHAGLGSQSAMMTLILWLNYVTLQCLLYNDIILLHFCMYTIYSCFSLCLFLFQFMYVYMQACLCLCFIITRMFKCLCIDSSIASLGSLTHIPYNFFMFIQSPAAVMDAPSCFSNFFVHEKCNFIHKFLSSITHELQ